MITAVDGHPTARKQHWCDSCARVILPGETYWQQTLLCDGRPVVHRICQHCERLVIAYCKSLRESVWERDDMAEWLHGENAALYAAMRAEWRWPDGELVPLPAGMEMPSA